MAAGAAHLGMFGTAESKGASRELTAIGRASEWLNSPRLTPEALAGKVVLVDFWTYTCINWLRTLPHVRAWSQKYRQQLVVIGVHTPEFAFEHDIDNVRRAVRQRGIEYPVVIDSDYSIWRAFNNQYWPALYFVDARGRIREHHFGEGQYEQSEQVIQRLLAEAGFARGDAGVASVDAAGVEAPADSANLKSPENYVGYDRTENFASTRSARIGSASPLRGACSPGAESVGAGWRVDGGEAGDRREQSQWADRVSLSRPRPSSRHGTAAARRSCAIPRVD